MPVEIAKSPNEKNDTLQPIIHLRKMLHRHPELSGQETGTAERIREFFTANHPTELITKIGGHGLAAVYNFSNEGLSKVTHNSSISANIRYVITSYNISNIFFLNPLSKKTRLPGSSANTTHP